LEFLHDYEEATQGLKDFVYQAIKNFAESNQKAYQQSNLVELMNKVVEARRGEIFEEQQIGFGKTSSSMNMTEQKLGVSSKNSRRA